MTRDALRAAFVSALDLSADADVEALEIGADPRWDSVGHMSLVAELEDRFGIELDTDDLIAMSSFAESVKILRRLGVEI
jgi:acyl carrier protein